MSSVKDISAGGLEVIQEESKGDSLWKSFPSEMNEARSSFNATLVGNKLFVFGGVTKVDKNKPILAKSVEFLNLDETSPKW